MGCCSSAPDTSQEDNAGTDVDMLLAQQQIQELFRFKVLLLGAGESGKSTIVKQLKLVHKEKIHEDELNLVAISLHQNVVDCTLSLITAAEKFGLEVSEEVEEFAEKLRERDDNDRLTVEEGEKIVEHFHSECLQEVFKRRNEFWILDSYLYYIAHLERFCADGFEPNEDDCVMARIRTTGMVVTDLVQRLPKPKPGTPGEAETPDRLQFKVVDVGGQRNERKKWLHCFDDVKCILFVVNLAGYDQVLFEDNTKNRMKESLELFSSVVSNKLFTDTPIFLFLNKKDLFDASVENTSISKVFPDYKGKNTVEDSLEFVKSKFTERLPPGKSGIQMLSVTGTAKRDIKMAFEAVKKRLYDTNKNALFEQVRELKRDFATMNQKKGKKKSKSSNV